MQDKTYQAVQASLSGNWEEAIEYNTVILIEDPDNIQALNRLARAYTELGQKDSAKEVYQKVLKIDKYNPIALRSLKQLPDKQVNGELIASDEDFIEEPGLTKSVNLIKTAGKDTLLSLHCKQELELSPRSRLISVKAKKGEVHVGCLPDDLSIRIGKLLKKGYGYNVCVKSVTDSTIVVFLREVKRPNSKTAAPSFSRTIKLKKLKRLK